MTFIAIRMLLGNPSKYLGMIFGVLFATLLMAHQSSIFWGLMLRTASQISDVAGADLWIMEPNVPYIEIIEPLRKIDIQLVKSVEGVAWAKPFIKGSVQGKKPDGTLQQIFLFGVDNLTLTGLPLKISHGKASYLYQPKSILLDLGGYDLLYPKMPWLPGQELEINQRKARVVGVADASPPFTTFPIAYTRYDEAVEYLSTSGTKKVSFILTKVKDPGQIQIVKDRIEAATNLKAFTKDEFILKTIQYYLEHTGIPINFGITVSLGFIVGIAIVAQTFYIFIIENLKHFGALKAIGANNRQILQIVMTQAALIGTVGYGLGIGISNLFFVLASSNTLIFRNFYLSVPIIAGTFIAVTLIIIIASVASLRAVFKLDPAIVFKM